jgi:hypothetical protein
MLRLTGWFDQKALQPGQPAFAFGAVALEKGAAQRPRLRL